MVLESRHHLVYFADPMCSWRWGFSHVIADIEKAFELPIHLVLGGLRSGTSMPMSDEDKTGFFSDSGQRCDGIPTLIAGGGRAMPTAS
ncbi:MAG: hypothetical protein ACYCZR_14700 [Burkholderiales bacterium]